MKKVILQLLLSLLVSTSLFGQCPTNLPFVAQAQVDSFIIAYPNCTEISGDLVIQGSAITNLNGLANITSITGNLVINQTSALQNLNGLSGLQSVGGSIGIVQTGLLNLNGLSAVTAVGGDIGIQGNLALTDISGLENIDPATISGAQGLYILGNPNVSVCNLSNFCTYLSFPAATHPRTIANNGADCSSVAVINASCSTDCPSGDLTFATQAEINSFALTYPDCTHILGNVTIEGGSSITNLNGLANLTNIAGNLTIQSNTALTNLNGLISLQNVGGNLTISQNSALQDVNGLGFVTAIGGSLTVSNNAQLIDILGIQNIDPGTISGLQIQNNTVLALCNLSNLCTYLLNPAATHPRTISGNAAACINEIAVIGSCSLTCPVGDIVFVTQAQVDGFLLAYPDCTEISGSLTIQGTGVTNLNGLTNITSIDGNLVINQATNLSNLDGLSSLETIGGNIGIAQSGVQNLNGLESLTAIGGALVIQANPALTDISGLENIDPDTIGGVGLTIVNNPQVSVCNLPNFCAYLANSATTHPRTILGNMGDCLTIVSVITSCTPAEPECAVPTNVSAIEVAFNNATINWTSVGTSFDIELVETGNPPTGNPTFAGVTKPYELTGLNPDTSYQVYVRQICEDDNQSEWSASSSFTTPAEDEPDEPDDPIGSQSFTFNTQQEIDEFPTENPGLTIVTGSVIIKGGDDITNLNGLSAITKINGNLIIGGFNTYNNYGQFIENGNNELTNLNGLSSLTEVGGNLTIVNNAQLENLSGLNALTTIGGNLTIGEHKRYNSANNVILEGGNNQLESLSGLTALISIGGNLSIANNDSLEDINALSSLTTVGTISNNATGNIYIGGNAQLLNCNGLSALTEVKGNLTIGSDNKYYSINSSIYFLDSGANAQLQNINGLNAITDIGGYLSVENNNLLQNLNGLSSVTSIGGSLIIENNSLLQNLSGLSSVTNVGGSSIYIQNNNSLQNLNGLSAIANSSISTLYITENTALQNLSGFSTAVTNINYLVIDGNTALQNLNGLSAVTNMDNGSVYIRGNPQLQNLGLSAVTSNNLGVLEIEGNSSLENLNGLSSSITNVGILSIRFNDNLETADLGSVTTISSVSVIGNYNLESISLSGTTSIGQLDITNNNSLLNLNGFGTSVTNLGSLTIRGNQNLENINALSNITSISGSLYIGHNPNLENLEGLDSLTSIGGSLGIEANDSLLNLDELSALTAINGELRIRQNSQLTDISGLENIDPDTILPIYDYSYSNSDYNSVYKGGLIIVHNPQLMVCNLPNFCSYLSNPITTHPRSIWGNAGSCINAGPCLTPPIACPTGDFVFSSQADVDGFELLYGDCSDIILNNVAIGNIDINLHSPVSDVSFLENVIGITGNLTVKKTSSLNNLTGLTQITSIGGNLELIDNIALQNLNGLATLSNIGGNITIDSNAALQNLNGLNSLTTINGNLYIYWNNALANLTGLGAVTAINGDLYIGYNDLLANLNGLNAVTTIDGNLYIVNNYLLANLNGLNAVTAIDGNLEITSNSSLVSIGLNTLTTIHGRMSVNNNNNLTNLNGLNSLTDVEEGLYITGNNSLQNLNGLSSLTDVTGILSITANGELADASGLENIDYQGINYLTIRNNNQLPLCSFPNLCTFLIMKPGQSSIYGNNTECATLRQVSNNCFSGNCDDFTIWKDEKWSNKEPNLQTRAIILEEFVVEEDLEACELEVYEIGSLTIEEEKTLTVNGQIINRAAATDFVVENKSNLKQTDDVANIGAITVNRSSNPMFRLDYTLWSSPVANQNLQAFSPETLPTRIYKYDAATDTYNNAYAETIFEIGQGYLFRSPNNWVVNDGTNTAQEYNGVFTGVPNNGNVTVNILADAYNGLGNPYPSGIDAADLFAENPGIQTIYFWTNTNPPVEGAYVANNWASRTTIGGTSAEGGAVEPNGEIATAQGFIAYVDSGTSVSFTNDMRIGSGQFFKQMQSEKHRFWLNLNNADNLTLNQILIGYVPEATQNVDSQIDGEMFGYGESALYSLIGNTDKQFIIQGRALPFEAIDVVPLGFRATTAGEFTISLANFDGLFAEGQNIYLKDNVTQAVHNLKEGTYTFISEEGTFDTRFEVVYQTTMSVETPDLNSNWVVFKQNDRFQILTQGFEMKEVQVFDMLGRTVYASAAEGTAHLIARIDANQVLIV
ncbi:MAG: hypothetical protein WCY89_01840, partial [Flavobacteriaceae bacterium]